MTQTQTMTGQTLTGLLVGSHFRPPAKQLLAVLPSGSKLELRPEPQNPYDPDAVAVYLAKSVLMELPAKALASLEDSLPSCGWTIRLLQGQPEIQLGYLARAGNRDLGKLPHLLPARALADAKVTEALLLWGPNGEATVRIQKGE